ncbi:ATP-binding protein [Melittangium boletus]|uniref:sensor histidine kinase n=1 Tax=Melittangium boletus TaxID=83453 RepID=UPI003DA3B811
MTRETARGGPYQHLDGLPFALAVLRDSRIVHANPALLTLLGVGPAEVLGTPLAHLLEGREPQALPQETVWRTPRGTLPVELTLSESGGDLYVLVRDASGRVCQRQLLQRLAALGASLIRLHSEDEVLRHAFQGLAELRIPHGYLVPEGERVRLAHVDVGEGTPPLVTPSGDWCDLLRDAWREGLAYQELPSGDGGVLGPDWAALAGPTTRGGGVPRALCLRIETDGAPRALLALRSERVGEDDLAPWRMFAAQVSAALDAARTIGTLWRRNTALSSLNRLAAAAATALKPQDLFEPGGREVASLMGSRTVILLLRAEGADALELAWYQGVSPGAEHRFQRIAHAGSMSARVMEEGVPRVVDVAEFADPVRSFLRESGQVCVVLVPLQVRSHMVGTIALAFDAPRVLTDLERETLQAMGAHFAATIETHRLLRELRERAEELTRLHSELADTQRQLVERERLAALGELSAVVAHEVRNPLGAIFNALATLRRFQEPASPALTLVGILSEEAHRLNRLVDDLLDFARPPSPQPQPVPLPPLLEEAVNTATVGQPGLRVEWALEPDVPPLPVDARMMRQVFLNLALNAVQAMPQGGTLRIHARRCQGPPGATVEFTDTGPGVPPSLHERLFEPFFTTKATGTGLGLAIVRRTLRAHGGNISIESPPAGGATFRVQLPLEAPSMLSRPPPR